MFCILPFNHILYIISIINEEKIKVKIDIDICLDRQIYIRNGLRVAWS